MLIVSALVYCLLQECKCLLKSPSLVSPPSPGENMFLFINCSDIPCSLCRLTIGHSEGYQKQCLNPKLPNINAISSFPLGELWTMGQQCPACSVLLCLCVCPSWALLGKDLFSCSLHGFPHFCESLFFIAAMLLVVLLTLLSITVLASDLPFCFLPSSAKKGKNGPVLILLKMEALVLGVAPNHWGIRLPHD